MAAVALVLHDEVPPMILALFATAGLGALFIWEVQRERRKTQRARQDLCQEVSGHIYRLVRWPSTRHILETALERGDETLEFTHRRSGALARRTDPLWQTWLSRAEAAEVNRDRNAEMHLLHLVAAVGDLETWCTAFDANELDGHHPKGALREFDARATMVITWATGWLRLQEFDWLAHAKAQDDDLARSEAARHAAATHAQSPRPTPDAVAAS